MKIVIINGSERKGNTLTAINTFIEGASANNEIEVIEAGNLNISGCKGCNACECYKGCVDKDDTNTTVDKIVNADMIVFTSPVYWWGVSAQLKLIIDKCYCKGAMLKGKKIGCIIIGGASETDMQYNLIKSQFECMAKYLNWDILFYKAISASGKDDLANKDGILSEMRNIGSDL